VGTPAEEFGPYVVYEQLGLGGMATVHRAETKGIAGFSKQVALKRMLTHVAADAGLVKSFIREARLASHLRHENVAQTYELGKVGDTYFIAMELITGRNLREILKHCAAVVGHMPLPIVLNIVNQICDALDYAHNLCDDSGQPLGIIHRDVSPSNIIVSEGGVVKLIDFGIAKASARTGMHTQSGTIKGKFSYMAPEYLMGSIDARADLFALGVIAHELLANRPLFQGKDDMDTLYRVKDMPILPPSRINPQVPPELDSVIMTALDRNPDQRWQRANALRQALTTETKRLGLYAHNAQVYEWIEKAFRQTKKGQFEEDSEPVISISSGTTELPRASSVLALANARGPSDFGRGTPSRDVPDEFSNLDGHETIVKRPSAKPSRVDDWNVTTDPTADPLDRKVGGPEWKGSTTDRTKLVRKSAPEAVPDPQLIDTRRDRSAGRPSSPHVIPRKTPMPGVPTLSARDLAARPAKASADQEATLQEPLDEDQLRTRPPVNSRLTEDDVDTLPPDATANDLRTQSVSDDARTLPPDARVDDFRRPALDADDVQTLPPDARVDDFRNSRPALEDDLQTLPPRNERPSAPPATKAMRPSTPMPIRSERPSAPPVAMPLGGPTTPLDLDRPSQLNQRADKPSQPPGLAPRSDSAARTMMIDPGARPNVPADPQPHAEGNAQPYAAGAFPAQRTPPNAIPVAAGLAAPGHVQVRTLPGAGVASPAPVSPASLLASGARTTPRMSASEIAEADQNKAAKAALNDLAVRGERPSAAKLLGTPAPQPQNTIMKTRIEMGKRSGASNFLLALLVLIAAGGAAAVVYFALPYLT